MTFTGFGTLENNVATVWVAKIAADKHMDRLAYPLHVVCNRDAVNRERMPLLTIEAESALIASIETIAARFLHSHPRFPAEKFEWMIWTTWRHCPDLSERSLEVVQLLKSSSKLKAHWSELQQVDGWLREMDALSERLKLIFDEDRSH